MQTNHIAVLVRDLEAVVNSLPDYCKRQSVETQPSEGTREQYVEVYGDSVSLLFVQPLGTEGPYARALTKRGPGLHHIGCITPSIRKEVSRQNLLLHPVSLDTFQKGVVWLCKPGLPFLVELMEAKGPDVPLEPCRLLLPQRCIVPSKMQTLSSNLTIANTSENVLFFEIGGRTIRIDPAVE